jgi:hypothetical protein
MAIRILQSINRNIEMRNIQETIPLQNSNFVSNSNESPPPYESQYTPPPSYQEINCFFETKTETRQT